jgi:hypothetical protein
MKSEAQKIYPLLLEEISKAQPGDGFNALDFATDLKRSTDDCLRFEDGIDCIVWRGGEWCLEPDD